MRITKFLTEDEFRAVMDEMRLTEKHNQMAKAVLVDRFRLQEVAEQNETSKQAVSQTIKRVWAKFLEMQNSLPLGWVSIRVSLPKEEAEKVMQLEAELKAKSLLKHHRASHSK